MAFGGPPSASPTSSVSDPKLNETDPKLNETDPKHCTTGIVLRHKIQLGWLMRLSTQKE